MSELIGSKSSVKRFFDSKSSFRLVQPDQTNDTSFVFMDSGAVAKAQNLTSHQKQQISELSVSADSSRFSKKHFETTGYDYAAIPQDEPIRLILEYKRDSEGKEQLNRVYAGEVIYTTELNIPASGDRFLLVTHSYEPTKDVIVPLEKAVPFNLSSNDLERRHGPVRILNHQVLRFSDSMQEDNPNMAWQNEPSSIHQAVKTHGEVLLTAGISGGIDTLGPSGTSQMTKIDPNSRSSGKQA